MSQQTLFISSVQKEFAEERAALKAFVEGDALLCRYFRVFLFEALPARDQRADEAYLQQVEQCAVYVGLFGEQYGFEDAAGLSPTEHEFDAAKARGLSRLIFVKGQIDAGRAPKMQNLINTAGAQLIRRRFASLPELTAALYASLIEHLEKSGVLRSGPFDASACHRAVLDDIADEKLRRFLRTARHARNYALDEAAPVRDALTHLNLLDHGAPTHAAVLLFAAQPQRFLPASELKCMHFHGTEVRKPIPSYQIYKGTVFELVDQAVDFVLAKIARTVGTRAAGLQAPETYELPRDAVAEAIVNAVAHRDYTSNASVQVMLFADRLEIWNPGELPAALTPERLRMAHASIPRNPLLAEPLFLARYIEKAGTGTLDMIALCREAGLREPTFRQEGGQFVQTLWRPVQVSDLNTGAQSGVESRVESGVESTMTLQILHCVRSRPLSKSDIALALGKAKPGRYLNDLMKKMLTDELVEYTIPDKPNSRLQQYRLTAKGQAALAQKDEKHV